MQRINQNISSLLKVLFNLPSNRFFFPIAHIALFLMIQIVLSIFYKGNAVLIALGDLGLIFYIFVIRYYSGKKVSFSTLRRISATHMFFLLNVILVVALSLALSRPISVLIAALSVPFSISYTVLRGMFLEGRVEPLVSLLFYYFFLLLPIYKAILSGLSWLDFYFWLASFVVTASFFYLSDRFAKKKLGYKIPNIAQAVLNAWLVEYPDDFENILERFSKEVEVYTYCLSFKTDSKRICVVVPPVHPGPFRGIGSYNVTEALSSLFKSKGFDEVIVLHSPSNHDMNIPSKRELDRYLSVISSEPSKLTPANFKVVKKEGKDFNFYGLSTDSFDFVIADPKRLMDDFPIGYMMELTKLNESREKPLVLVDAHNKLSTYAEDIDFSEPLRFNIEPLSSEEIMVSAERLELGALPEVGQNGVHTLIISDGQEEVRLLCVDSNNADPNAYQKVLNETGFVIVTSDTHVVKTSANKKGYWAFGEITPLSNIIEKLKENHKLEKAEAQLLFWKSNVKVMGERGLQVLKEVMSGSLNRFKIYVSLMFAILIIALIL